MEMWLRNVLAQVEEEYESLPEWKKKLWEKKQFAQDRESSRTKQNNDLRYDNNDWT